MNFKTNSHFALFGSFGIHTKDTNFIFGTPHTQKYRYTHRHVHTQTDTNTIFTFCTFWLIGHMLKILILYLAHHTHTEIQIHTDTCTRR